MWMTAFFGMTTKFVEVTLSHKYREKTQDGTMAVKTIPNPPLLITITILILLKFH